MRALPAVGLVAIFLLLGVNALEPLRTEREGTPPDAELPPADPPVPPPQGPGTSATNVPGQASWSHYGLDLSGSRAPLGEATLSRDTLPGLRQRWNVTFGGAATGTPVVAEGRVFVGSWDGRLHAFDARTGAALWNATLQGPVSGTVALAEGSVFVGDGKAWLYRFDAATGVEQWRMLTDLEPASRIYGSPLVHNGTVYLGVASDQHSVRLYPEPAPLTFHGSVVAVDAATGQLRWRFWTQRPGLDGFGGSVWSTPVLDPGSDTLFVGTGQAYTAPDGPHVDAMLALDATTGEARWVFKATKGDVWTQRKPQNPDWDFGSSPVLVRGDGGRLLVVEAQKSSVVFARDALTGEEVWTHGRPRSGSDIVASPAVLDGVLFLPSVADRNVLALDVRTGALRWNASLNSGVWSAPAALPTGIVLVGTGGSGHLVALDAATGGELHRWPTGRGGIFGGISVADGLVYTATVPQGFLSPEGALIAWGLP